MRKLILVIALFWALTTSAQSEVIWWLNGSTQKIVATTPILSEPLLLHSGRLEYAPFQLAIAPSEAERTFTTPTVQYDSAAFSITWYEQVYLPILITPNLSEIFTLVRDTTSKAIPDGLRPLGESWTVQAGNAGALWADLYVNAGTAPGDYPINVTFMGTTQTVTVRVYDVDIPPTRAVSILIPTDKLAVVPEYSDGDDEGFLQELNQLMLDHLLISATFVGEPTRDGTTWDFSYLDEQLDALPEEANFHAPMPYSEATESYVFDDENGEPYVVTDFENAHFVAQLENYFSQLADYLNAKGRLSGALAYPDDETRWVADEPDHNGPGGYQHLANWKSILNRYGLRVTASRVSPALYALDWLPSAEVTDDTHVHLDVFDADVTPYIEWMKNEGKTSSVYLNHYGDMVELPAATHRALAWRVYGRGIRNITGYEMMDWFDERWNYVRDPMNQPELLDPKFTGYGVGQIIYPGPLPSIRLKILRESVEDARLLDLYGYQFGSEEAESFAACMTPVAIADFNPASDLWDKGHAALLMALTTNTLVDRTVCPPPPTFTEQVIVADMEDNVLSGGEWTMQDLDFASVESPWDGSLAYQLTFTSMQSVASYWMGGKNWSGHDTLLVDVQNPTPYYAELDFAIGDMAGNYILLRPNSTNIAPNSTKTLEMPLVVAFPYDVPFDFANVAYLELSVATETEQTDGFGVEQVYPLGSRTLIFDNIRLAKKQ
jgi:hypothetical protein